MRKLALAFLLVLPLGAWAQPAESEVVWLPSPPQAVDAMLRLAAVTNADVVYDPGCGDGRVLVRAATIYGARAVGIEIQHWLVVQARTKVRESGVERLVRVIEGDMYATTMREATVVVIYQPPEVTWKLLVRLAKDLKPGTRVVTYGASKNAESAGIVRLFTLGMNGKFRIGTTLTVPHTVVRP